MADTGPAIALGVDAFKKQWVGVTLDRAGRFVEAYLEADIETLVRVATDAHPIEVVGIDIPIGLPDKSERSADQLAKDFIGVRRSSVFMTPTRAALELDTFPAAVIENRRLVGKGFSVQAWGLREKLLEVDVWVRSKPKVQVIEVHPEVSFTAMNKEVPLPSSKKSWAGVAVRQRLLIAAGIEIGDQLGKAGRAGVDDVLDAAAAAWSAHRVFIDRAERLPRKPQKKFSDGIDAAIWY